MSLSREQFIYVLSQTGKGLEVEKVTAKWNSAYPQDQIDADDAVAYLDERQHLVDEGMQSAKANEVILEYGIGYQATRPKFGARATKHGKDTGHASSHS